jgi:hypothetical protein
VGLGLGLPENNPPTGLLTKTQPNPRVGFSWAGLGGGRVLARPRRHYHVTWRGSGECRVVCRIMIDREDQITHTAHSDVIIGLG